MIKRLTALAILTTLLPLLCSAQANIVPDDEIAYKTVGRSQLKLHIFYPDNHSLAKASPAIVFFFGGGWNGGSTEQFEPQAKYFAERGMVCFLADYRVKSRQETTPFESLKDAKSAMRFIRKNASDFHVDPDKIVASGGSAGGHLAAATAFIENPKLPVAEFGISYEYQ